MKNTTLIILLTLLTSGAFAQACTPQGDQTTYGTGNTWIGYVYQGTNFNTYKGYVTEGTATNPNFNESFGGSQVNYNTNGCTAYTDRFSVRYKLLLSYSGTYDITIGGDDGVRLSIDGGATWLINQWQDQGYTTFSVPGVTLGASTSLVLEYYEHFGGNQVSFNMTASCVATGNPATYGTNNTWIGYLYQGMNFNTYKGFVNEGNSANPNFDENFGNSGSAIAYGTSSCSIQTQQFSARYRLQKTFTNGTYQITIGGDDGYRLSLDGGSTWAINKWVDQSYASTTYTGVLNGTYNMVLEYYQNGGSNRVSFNISGGTILPLTLTEFIGQFSTDNSVLLNWNTMVEINTSYFTVQRSSDATDFQDIAQVNSKSTETTSAYELNYAYTDHSPLSGTSYYRLQITDKDGNTSHSGVVQLANSKAEGIKIFPTIVQNNSLFVQSDKSIRNAKLEIFDISGKKMSESNWEVLSGSQSVTILANGHMPSGTYLARLTTNGERLINQLIMVQNR
jgi:hypothetical protein